MEESSRMICFCGCAMMKALKDNLQLRDFATEKGDRKIQSYFAREDTVLVV